MHACRATRATTLCVLYESKYVRMYEDSYNIALVTTDNGTGSNSYLARTHVRTTKGEQISTKRSQHVHT